MKELLDFEQSYTLYRMTMYKVGCLSFSRSRRRIEYLIYCEAPTYMKMRSARKKRLCEKRKSKLKEKIKIPNLDVKNMKNLHFNFKKRLLKKYNKMSRVLNKDSLY